MAKRCGTTGSRCMQFNEGKLTPKEMRFAEEYIKDFNATQAAIRAGITNDPGYGGTIGSLTLKKDHVRDYIEQLMSKISEQCMTDVNDLMGFWTEVMLNPNESTANRLKASDYLAKALGAYNVKVETNQAPTIVMDLGLPPAQEHLAIAPAVEIIMEDDEDLEEEQDECDTE